MTGTQVAFAAFGVGSQAMLLGFFVARRWWPRLASRFGWVVYAVAAIGLPLAVWLFLDGQPWTLIVGPLLMAAWALLGAIVDLWRPRQWRRPPIAWNVLIPFVALYFLAQMFMWWPLWTIERAAWLLFLVLFVPSTIVNIRGHVDEARTGRPAE